MTIGISLFAIALGAILKFAVTAQVTGIDLSIVGVILMVVGGIGLCVGLWLYLADRESADRVSRR
jgi:Flp pilus assembly protein protease CpaA